MSEYLDIYPLGLIFCNIFYLLEGQLAGKHDSVRAKLVHFFNAREVVDGELQRIREAAAMEIAKKQARVEQGMARSLPDLVRIGVNRNMRNPAYWAATVHASRQRRKPTRQEIHEARQLQTLLKAESFA